MNALHSPPRVLHVITHLALGGAERVSVDLARGLRPEFEPAIWAVHGVLNDGIGNAMSLDLRSQGIAVFTGSRLALKHGGIVAAAWQAGRITSKFQPDLVHLHTEIPEFSWAIANLLSGRTRTIPVIRTIHNSEYWHHWKRLGHWTDRRLANAEIAVVSRAAAHAFEHLRRGSGANAPPAPPRLIVNAVPAMPPAKAAPASGVRNVLRVLYAGRFEAQKGADLLPEILATVKLPIGRSAELVLHGSGTQKNILDSLARNPPPGWKVQVCPPTARLVETMATFDILVMPSRFEGTSVLAIEAMMVGVPLVATDAPGLRDQLPPQHPWVAVAGNARDFATVFERALHNPAGCRMSAESAQAFSRITFNHASLLHDYRQLYQQALVSRRL